MTILLIILVIAFSFEAIGIVSLKRGLDKIVVRYNARVDKLPRWKNVLRLLGDWFASRDALIGLALLTTFFILLQCMLGMADVSFVWPLTALSFVLTTLAARLILKEEVDGWRWAGVALILAGAALILYSENVKKKNAMETPAVNAAGGGMARGPVTNT